jgi:alcohol dehydrogenase class IV
MIHPFSVARLPRIEFGAGSVARLPELLAGYGRRVLLVTGARSFPSSPHWESLLAGLKRAGLTWEQVTVDDEPSPALVDGAVQRLHGANIDVVAAIGGGSVLDAAKAMAGLLPSGDSVMDYLEGVGAGKAYQGPAVPFIAVPTTAGTGSEATKNAVLSERGENGFKKSFRHDLLAPEYALLDPDLLATCPPNQIAANAMDALTQLLESYVSAKANPFTDSLAEGGMAAVRRGLFAWYEGGENAAAGRSELAYGALISGICLAQAGLGSVHGLASPLGAFYPIPHGVVCGTLVAAASQINIQALRERDPDHPSLGKYARAGAILSGRFHEDDDEARAALVKLLGDWTQRLELPVLSHYGIGEADFPRIVANCRGGSMRTNPIVLTDEEVAELMLRRL